MAKKPSFLSRLVDRLFNKPEADDSKFKPVKPKRSNNLGREAYRKLDADLVAPRRRRNWLTKVKAIVRNKKGQLVRYITEQRVVREPKLSRRDLHRQGVSANPKVAGRFKNGAAIDRANKERMRARIESELDRRDAARERKRLA